MVGNAARGLPATQPEGERRGDCARAQDQPELGLIPVGYVDSQPPPAEQVGGRHLSVLGGTDELAAITHRTGAKHVVLAFSSAP